VRCRTPRGNLRQGHPPVPGVRRPPAAGSECVFELDTEVAALDDILEPMIAATAPELVAQVGVGTDTAGALLVAAGENTSRLRNERSFARLCGAAPLDASSGKQQRHRLSRSGDRQLGALADRDQPALPPPNHAALPPTPTRPRQNQDPKPSAASLGEYQRAGHRGSFVGSGEGRPRCLATGWPV
jgi:Transposase IS116/IS110/IS902 family